MFEYSLMMVKTYLTVVFLSALHFSVWHAVLCRYATIYTMFPVFSLVLDQDVKPEMALLYPELYKDLTKVPSKVPLSAFFLPNQAIQFKRTHS